MGWHLAPSLHAEGALAALNQAIALADGKVEGLIHHSDRDVQYTCLDYLLRLQEVGARPSMGTTGNCYENALAERVNGTLKVEYCLEDGFVDYPQAWKAVSQVVTLYNNDRPHLALDYLTPTQVYLRHLHSPVAPTQIDSSSAHDPPACLDHSATAQGEGADYTLFSAVPCQHISGLDKVSPKTR